MRRAIPRLCGRCAIGVFARLVAPVRVPGVGPLRLLIIRRVRSASRCWLELGDTPWQSKAHVLVGAFSHSGRFRAWITSSQDQPHLVEGIDAVLRRLGGTARRWRVDRMATVVVPGADRIQPSFVGVAKHYGVGVDPCPPRHPQRKGVVEKAIHYISQRWWRTAMVNSLAQAQDSLDNFCLTVGDTRRRGDSTVAELADRELLLGLPPMPYAAEGSLIRRVAANGLVSVWGNRYSVPPGVIGTQVTIRWRLGDPTARMGITWASWTNLRASRQVRPPWNCGWVSMCRFPQWSHTNRRWGPQQHRPATAVLKVSDLPQATVMHPSARTPTVRALGQLLDRNHPHYQLRGGVHPHTGHTDSRQVKPNRHKISTH